MKAEITNIYSKDRVPLHKVVPLNTPFTVIIEPTTFCNLKCRFCLHSFSENDILESGHIFETMRDETFNRLIEQIKEFPQKIKSVNFAGVGEPLLHNKLPQMISQLKDTGKVEKVSIITNGIPLNHKLSRDLVNAGTDSIKISINGLKSDDYYMYCSSHIDYDKFHSEIVYLYENKGDMELGIKILDSCLGEGGKEDFFEQYGNYCDIISVEKTLPLYEELSYDKIIADASSLSRYDLNRQERVKICPSPFFKISIRSTGQIMICCPYNGLELSSMNVNTNTLLECWNSEEHKKVLFNILAEKYEGITAKCKKCSLRDDFAFSEDILDNYGKEIYERICSL
jgi:sulfatase maturation enzyme AslB (radical SAM superfamily)